MQTASAYINKWLVKTFSAFCFQFSVKPQIYFGSIHTNLIEFLWGKFIGDFHHVIIIPEAYYQIHFALLCDLVKTFIEW